MDRRMGDIQYFRKTLGRMKNMVMNRVRKRGEREGGKKN